MNATERAACEALLAAMRAHRAQSPDSSYRTVYEVVISNVVTASYKLRVATVPIAAA